MNCRTHFKEILTLIVTVVVLLFSRPTNLQAQDADVADAAYNRGDYVTAFREWKTLAGSVGREWSKMNNSQRSAAANKVVATLKVRYMMGAGQVRERPLGIFTPWKSDAVRQQWQEAAENGSANAQFWYGVAFEILDENYVEAGKWYRQAAEKNFAPAQYALGNLYAGGRGVDGNYAEALSWYQKSASLGEAAAMVDLGNAYYNCSSCGVANDHEKAMEWYRKAAERGDAKGQYQVGLAYEQDYNSTRQAYNVRLPRGVKGPVYPPGIGKLIQDNLQEALRWYQKATDQGTAGGYGSIQAATALAQIYEDGKGSLKDVPNPLKDEDKASVWYGKAVEWDRSFAASPDEYPRIALAHILAKPTFHGGNSASIAAELFREVAERGDLSLEGILGEAQYQLGILYAEGRGVPQDYVLGHMWLNLAASNQDWLRWGAMPGEANNKLLAAAARDSLTKKMTAEQIANAQELARNWQPSKNPLNILRSLSESSPPRADSIATAIARIETAQHSPLPPLPLGSGSGPITIQNDTSSTLTVYFSGGVNLQTVIPPSSRMMVTLRSGAYKIAGELSDKSVIPFFGVRNYSGGEVENFYIKR